MLGDFEEQPREQCDWKSDWNRERKERGKANGRRPRRPGCVPGTEETAENKTEARPETSTVIRGSRGTEERQADTQTFQSPERPLKEITRESGWVHGAAEGTASDRGPEGL